MNKKCAKLLDKLESEGKVKIWEDFEFPLPFDNGVRLKDLLEEDVDERYYISEDKCRKLLEELNGELRVKQATKQGYAVAEPYDSINIKFPGSSTRGGRVQKESASTLETSCNQAVVIPAQPNVLRPVRTDYGKAIRKQYEAGEIQESRHNMTQLQPRTDEISNTITTVQKDNLLCVPQGVLVTGSTAKVIDTCNTLDAHYGRGLGCNQSRTGVLQQVGLLDIKGNEQVRRVYSTDGISPTLNTCGGGNRQPKIIVEVGLNGETKGYTREVLSGVWTEARTEDIQWSPRGFNSVQQSEVLQPGMHEEELQWPQDRTNREHQDFEKLGERGSQERLLWDMSSDRQKIRCSSQGRESIKQQSKEPNNAMQELPYQTTSPEEIVYDLRTNSKGSSIMQQAPNTDEEVWKSTNILPQYSIRKLTVLEVFRLMGFSDSDYHRLKAANISNSQLYKMAGNSIVVPVIEALYKSLGFVAQD